MCSGASRNDMADVSSLSVSHKVNVTNFQRNHKEFDPPRVGGQSDNSLTIIKKEHSLTHIRCVEVHIVNRVIRPSLDTARNNEE